MVLMFGLNLWRSELARELGERGVMDFASIENVIRKSDRSLVECFKLFDLIRILTTDHEAVTRITREVIEDFASENVVYLELRTTPKKNEAVGMSKRSYIQAVLDGLRSVDAVDVDFIPSDVDRGNSKKTLSINDNGVTKTKIFVRLLLSIDRRETGEAAMETVKLALEMKDLGVVGVDLSGNPAVGEWDTFLPALNFAREHGLPIVLHCGELPDRLGEVREMLNFYPQRIGHAIFLDDEQWRLLKLSKIPVEICLTSNVLTGCVTTINDHHFIDLYNSNHPLLLCTDDPGVFSTSLSREYFLASSAFGLGREEMFEMGRMGIDYIFADERVKKELREIFSSFAAKEF
ncbi:hypothetical protein Sjap_025274 [Stephania japonica]|uniref:Adenosine deaminase domain-containing protein n=1 Tax=Stephania japonica TaxID=461633 RepID=A0AAP0E966_9MAGN